MTKLTGVSRSRLLIGGLAIAAMAALAGTALAQDRGNETRRSKEKPAKDSSFEARREPDLRAGAAGLGVRPGDTKAANTKPAAIERLSGVWVEGPGYDIKYGANYETCEKRCLEAEKCVMIEYYRPEKKCNLYDRMRPRKTGGSSDVAIRASAVAEDTARPKEKVRR